MEHPLEKFTHCPACGSTLWTEHNWKSKHCEACGFTFYSNPSAATAAFIVRNGQLLVARRGKEPARGTQDLPGGFCDHGETAEEGMAREILEETGLQASRMSYLFSLPNIYEYAGMRIHTLDLFFRVDVDDTAEPRAADDAASLEWVALSDVRPEAFGLDSVRRAVGIFLKGEFS